jgi:pyruvate dehydrogenase E2 component (dihydrolipoamide acetyltransferase)
MARAFTLPDLGEGIHEAEIQEVLVKEGAPVEEGDAILVVETDKAMVEVPSPYTGTIAASHVSAGEVVQVGDVLITFDETAADAGVPAGKVASREAEEPTEEEPAPAAASAAAVEPARPIPASPVTRRLARELAVDLHWVSPSGPAGRVTAEDVRAFAEQQGKAAEAGPPKKTRPIQPALPRTEAQPDFSRWVASSGCPCVPSGAPSPRRWPNPGRAFPVSHTMTSRTSPSWKTCVATWRTRSRTAPWR